MCSGPWEPPRLVNLFCGLVLSCFQCPGTMPASTAYLEPRNELEPSFDCSSALKLMNVEGSVNARFEFCLKYISTKPERG